MRIPVSAIELKPGVDVLFFIIALLVSAALIFLLILSIRRERRRYNESKIEEDVNTFAWFEKYIHQQMLTKKKKSGFYLYLITVSEHEEVQKTLGKVQYENMFKQMCKIVSKLQPWGVKASIRNNKSIIAYVRGGSVDLDKLSQLMITNITTDDSIKSSINIEIAVNAACIAFPTGGNTFLELLENLDLTMVEAKRKGVNSYAYYSADMADKESAEYKYYQEIKDAMKAKEFMLFYQPIVDIKTMDVVSCESLIRWKHRTMGILPPSQFLYVMEQTGDINWVGFWCFDQLVKQHVSWITNHENHFDISINISERQMLNPLFADEMRKIVRKYKANPNNFVMEMGNVSFFSTSSIIKQNLEKLHEFGFKIAFDGFDGQQSSPVALAQLPFDIIKIDSKLWKRAKEDKMAEDVLKMFARHCSENKKTMMSLSVEDGEDIEYLKGHGFDIMQGYAFAPPKEARDFISDVLLTPWVENLKNPQRAKQTQITETAIAPENRVVADEEILDEPKPFDPPDDDDDLILDIPVAENPAENKVAKQSAEKKVAENPAEKKAAEKKTTEKSVKKGTAKKDIDKE